MLDQALRQVLGTHVEQKGSLVTPEGIRFDFSHFQKVTDEEIEQVERIVNARIRENIPLTDYRNIPIEEAKQLGAIALFGEKYGDHVRVVQFGTSIEFCGGTHVSATGNIGMVKIISESSVAAGVRRIEAITGEALENHLYKTQTLMKEIEEYAKEKAAMMKNQLLNDIKERNGMRYISAILPMAPATVKDIAFMLRQEQPENLLIVLGSIHNDKPQLTISVSADLVERGINAGKIVGQAAREMQGGGGGQAHFAQAGGKNPEGVKAAIDKVFEIIEA